MNAHEAEKAKELKQLASLCYGYNYGWGRCCTQCHVRASCKAICRLLKEEYTTGRISQ